MTIWKPGKILKKVTAEINSDGLEDLGVSSAEIEYGLPARVPGVGSKEAKYSLTDNVMENIREDVDEHGTATVPMAIFLDLINYSGTPEERRWLTMGRPVVKGNFPKMGDQHLQVLKTNVGTKANPKYSYKTVITDPKLIKELREREQLMYDRQYANAFISKLNAKKEMKKFDLWSRADTRYQQGGTVKYYIVFSRKTGKESTAIVDEGTFEE